jgi:hypothetical protein
VGSGPLGHGLSTVNSLQAWRLAGWRWRWGWRFTSAASRPAFLGDYKGVWFGLRALSAGRGCQYQTPDWRQAPGASASRQDPSHVLYPICISYMLYHISFY